MEVVGQHHNALGSSYILHILGQYDHIDLVGLQQFIQAVHGTQISRQTLAGGGVQVAHILHGGASAALDHIAEEAVGQLPAADEQCPGHDVVLTHVSIRQPVKHQPLEVDHNDRQQVIIYQQQTGKLADAEHVKRSSHQRQAHQAGQRDKKKLLDAVAQVQCAVAAQHGVTAYDHQRIQGRNGQERPDVPHKELAAHGCVAAQPAGKDESKDQQQKLESGVCKPQKFGFVIMHAGPPLSRLSVTGIQPFIL